jgi:hypothetical protein
MKHEDVEKLKALLVCLGGGFFLGYLEGARRQSELNRRTNVRNRLRELEEEVDGNE